MGVTKRRKTTLAVGDVFASAAGRVVEITAIDPQALTITVTLERTVFTRGGELLTDTRERVVPKELWPTFARSYKKVKA